MGDPEGHQHRRASDLRLRRDGILLFLIDSVVFADFKPAYFAACLLGAAEKQELSQPPKAALSVFTSSNCHLVVLMEALPAQRYCLPALHFEHPAVAWAVMRGMLVSADYASTPPNLGSLSRSPKNRGPFHRVPVIAKATLERLS